MALALIVYMPDANKLGPDLNRMNTVEDVPDEVARMWFNDGTARPPTDDEIAEYEQRHAIEAKADEAVGSGDLTSLRKAELETMAADLGVEVPHGATKADIAGLIEDKRAAQQDQPLIRPAEASYDAGTPTDATA